MKKIFFLIAIISSFLSNGQSLALDTSFGGSGYLSTSFNTTPSKGCFEGGKYYLLGNSTAVYNSLRTITCLNYDGSIDNAFGNNGMQEIAMTNRRFYMSNIKVHNGMVYVLGQTYVVGSGSSSNGGVVRLDATGNIDTSFGTDGVVLLTTPGTSGFEDILFNNDGTFFIGGYAGDMLLYKYLQNGTLDLSYNNTGYKALSFESDYLQARKLYPTADGFIFVGSSWNSAFVFKFDASGELITDFGNAGMIRMIGTTAIASQEVIDVEVLENKVYIMISQAMLNMPSVNVVKAFDLSAPDTLLYTAAIFSPRGYFKILNSGKILQTNGTSSGFGTFGSYNRHYEIRQYNETGIIDTNFNETGTGTFDFPGTNSNSTEGATYLFVHDDGKIFIAGISAQANNTAFLSALRIIPGVLTTNAFDNENSFDIYPNPASEILHLKNTSNKIIDKITLYDISGKTIELTNFTQNTIDVSKLQKGIYFLNVVAEEKNYNLKFIKS